MVLGFCSRVLAEFSDHPTAEQRKCSTIQGPPSHRLSRGFIGFLNFGGHFGKRSVTPAEVSFSIYILLRQFFSAREGSREDLNHPPTSVGGICRKTPGFFQ
jgi:hypothetical protein